MDWHFAQNQGVGDNVVLTAFVHDLKAAFQEDRIWVTLNWPDILLGNPDVEHSAPPANIRQLVARYMTEYSWSGIHFCHSFHRYFSENDIVHVPCGDPRPYLYPQPLRDNLRYLLEKPYMVVDAGWKCDFPAKHWGTANYQQVVDDCRQYVWVQVGGKTDRHRPLDGVVNLVGQTSIADLISLIANSVGVLTPVSCPAHIAGGVGKQCVTIAGGREQASWESYPGHYYMCTYTDDEPACWRSNLMSPCRRVVVGGEQVAGCMLQIGPRSVSEIINGDAWQLGRQTDYRKYSAMAPGGCETYREIRQGSSRCGEKNRCSQQATQRLDRRVGRAIRQSNQGGVCADAAQSEAVLKASFRDRIGRGPVKRDRPMASWRRRQIVSTPREKIDAARVNGTTYFAANTCIKMGDFLGDTITQIIAMHIIWESERPQQTILSLYAGEPLNFLWDAFIQRTNAIVHYDPAAGSEVGAKYETLNERRLSRKIAVVDQLQPVSSTYTFDNYKECYRRIDSGMRNACWDKRVDSAHNIIESYYYGQEYSVEPMPYWTSGPQYFLPFRRDAVRFPDGAPYVLVSPLEKCQNNAIFTFPMWRDVVKILLDRKINVLINERSKFCADLQTPHLLHAFAPFSELMEQVAGAKVVACGNTGPMWAAAACGTSSVICENDRVAMPEYTAKRARLDGLRYICNDPDPAYIADRITEVYRW